MANTISIPWERTTPKGEKAKIATSQAGKGPPLRACRRRGGFTLLEVLVVVALLALVSSLAAPLLARAGSGVEAHAAARQVAATLRKSRARAIIENRDLAVRIAVADHVLRIDGRVVAKLPDSLRMRVSSARSEQENATTAGIRFFPDGSATGGEIILGDAQSIYHVQVEWLTGQVAIVRGGAN